MIVRSGNIIIGNRKRDGIPIEKGLCELVECTVGQI